MCMHISCSVLIKAIESTIDHQAPSRPPRSPTVDTRRPYRTIPTLSPIGAGSASNAGRLSCCTQIGRAQDVPHEDHPETVSCARTCAMHIPRPRRWDMHACTCSQSPPSTASACVSVLRPKQNKTSGHASKGPPKWVGRRGSGCRRHPS